MEASVAGFRGLIGVVSLLIGALVGIYAGASPRVISVVMAIGAGSSGHGHLGGRGIGRICLPRRGIGERSRIQAFAAGAIPTMLASTMMPEAYEEWMR